MNVTVWKVYKTSANSRRQRQYVCESIIESSHHCQQVTTSFLKSNTRFRTLS